MHSPITACSFLLFFWRSSQVCLYAMLTARLLYHNINDQDFEVLEEGGAKALFAHNQSVRKKERAENCEAVQNPPTAPSPRPGAPLVTSHPSPCLLSLSAHVLPFLLPVPPSPLQYHGTTPLSPQAQDLLCQLLHPMDQNRITLEAILQHPFLQEPPKPKKPEGNNKGEEKRSSPSSLAGRFLSKAGTLFRWRGSLLRDKFSGVARSKSFAVPTGRRGDIPDVSMMPALQQGPFSSPY